MKRWILATAALAVLAVPLSDAFARGGRRGGGYRRGGRTSIPRSSRGRNNKADQQLRERSQAELKDAILTDHGRDRR